MPSTETRKEDASQLCAAVRHVLDGWRQRNGWQPGMVWNPYAGGDAKAKRGGRYEWPQGGASGAPDQNG